MRGYNCDMCGKWFSNMTQFGVLREVYDDEFDDDISHNVIIDRPYDLCPKCLQKVVNYIRQEDEQLPCLDGQIDAGNRYIKEGFSVEQAWEMTMKSLEVD